MHLFYYRGNNFGDELNPYLFNTLVPDLFKEESEEDYFLGIGSVIGFREDYQHARNKYIFSTGFAYGKLPKIDNSFHFISVRGPLTAEKLGLGNDMYITDGAVLTKRIYNRKPEKKYKFSFMPHWESDLKYNWKYVCQECGIHYIKPTTPVEKALDEINDTEVMISEAMHSAIIADTLRIPWIPLKIYGATNSFKWNDWLMSMDLKYQPVQVPWIYDNKNYFKKTLMDKIKGSYSSLIGSGVYPLYTAYRKLFLEKKVIKSFEALKKGQTFLSKESTLNTKIDLLENRLFEFYHSWKKKNA